MPAMVIALVRHNTEKLVFSLIQKAAKRQLFRKRDFRKIFLREIAHVVDRSRQMDGQDPGKSCHTDVPSYLPLGSIARIRQLDTLWYLLGIHLDS